MNPFYICNTCGVYYAYKPDHCMMLMDENVYCSTPIKTSFYAEYIFNELENRLDGIFHDADQNKQNKEKYLSLMSKYKAIEEFYNAIKKLTKSDISDIS